MKFRLSTLLLIVVIACLTAGWIVERGRWASERATLTAERSDFATRICNGSQTIGAAVEFRDIMEIDSVKTNLDQKQLELLVFNQVRSIWSAHADINFALLQIEGIQTTNKYDYAQYQAFTLLELANLPSVESFFAIGIGHSGYNFDKNSYPEIFDKTSTEHQSFSTFVSPYIEKSEARKTTHKNAG